MTEPIRIALSEADFRALVAGQVVPVRGAGGQAVEIILSDIGWDRLDKALTDAALKRLLDEQYPEGAD